MNPSLRSQKDIYESMSEEMTDDKIKWIIEELSASKKQSARVAGGLGLAAGATGLAGGAALFFSGPAGWIVLAGNASVAGGLGSGGFKLLNWL